MSLQLRKLNYNWLRSTKETLSKLIAILRNQKKVFIDDNEKSNIKLENASVESTNIISTINIKTYMKTYKEIDLYNTALSKSRVPHGPVNSGLMTCFKSSDKS